MSWTYQGNEIKSHEDLIPECQEWYGFIYKLTFENNQYYYGMKSFFKFNTLPALKSGEQRPNSTRKGKNKNGKRVYFDIVKKESNWKEYEGSSEKTQELILIKKEILALARTKREMTYLEVKCLMQTEALEEPLCLNSNILNVFFRDNLL